MTRRHYTTEQRLFVARVGDEGVLEIVLGLNETTTQHDINELLMRGVLSCSSSSHSDKYTLTSRGRKYLARWVL
jgi:hypothetical protein